MHKRDNDDDDNNNNSLACHLNSVKANYETIIKQTQHKLN